MKKQCLYKFQNKKKKTQNTFFLLNELTNCTVPTLILKSCVLHELFPLDACENNLFVRNLLKIVIAT
jgi:hypothetical protein